MDWYNFQENTETTAVYPGANSGDLVYVTLGLVGEAGEVAELVKKQLRAGKDFFDPEFVDKMQEELGDVFWYLARLLKETGLDYNEVLLANVEKLATRKAGGTLKNR